MPVSQGRSAALFLSYAHYDNEPLVAGQPGWVENFQRALKVRLTQILGREPHLWWDRATMRGNDVIGAAIGDGIDRSTVMVAIVSPSYVDFERSDWCRKELESFRDAAERQGVPPDVRNRIFKVVKTHVDLERQPAILKDLRGYEFYRRDPATGRLREFYLQPAAPVDPAYIEKIDDLAEDIRLFMKNLETAPVPAAAPAAPVTAAPAAPLASPVLYLAETTSDLTPDREQLARMLRQAHHTVLPDRELPIARGATLRESVRECLRRTTLSVHLVGANFGAVPEGETQSVTAIQNELAAERAADPSFSRLIWIPADVRPADERQREFLERLRADPGAQRGAEILHGGLAELGTEIQNRLQPRAARPAIARKPEARDALKDLYLICNQKDREAGEALRDLIYATYPGVEVWLPPVDGEEADIRAIHREYLTLCDGVLLYFGRASDAWVQSMLCELKRAGGYERRRPLPTPAIYLGPPVTPAKERFRTREALVIQAPTTPSIAPLVPFFAQLGLEPTA